MVCSSSHRKPTRSAKRVLLLWSLAALLGFQAVLLHREQSRGSSKSSSEGLEEAVGVLPGRTVATNNNNTNTTSTMTTTNAAAERLLPTPILVVGLPKTGTSTIHAFFEKSGYRSSHYKCTNGLLCGSCIKAAIKKGEGPLGACGGYEVWAQMDVENLGLCHFPQISDLEALHAEAPGATLLLSTRNLTRWATSVKNWVGGSERSMAARLSKCKKVGPSSKQRGDLIRWHEEHLARIRRFVGEHPSHALVEIDIEDPRAGEILSERFGAPSSHWGHENDSLKKNASRTTSRAE